MIVFPESMNTLDAENAVRSIETLEGYIDYMRQRIEWAMRNVTKSVSSGNTTSAEMYILFTALQNTVSALQSTVYSHGATISAILQTLTLLQNDVAEVEGRCDALGSRITALETAQTTLNTQIASIETNYTALDERVTALEQEANQNGNEYE